MTSVAWYPDVRDLRTTGTILVGTNQGLVFEAEIDKSEKIDKMDKYFKQVYAMQVRDDDGIFFAESFFGEIFFGTDIQF